MSSCLVFSLNLVICCVPGTECPPVLYFLSTLSSVVSQGLNVLLSCIFSQPCHLLCPRDWMSSCPVFSLNLVICCVPGTGCPPVLYFLSTLSSVVSQGLNVLLSCIFSQPCHLLCPRDWMSSCPVFSLNLVICCVPGTECPPVLYFLSTLSSVVSQGLDGRSHEWR